MIQTLYPSYWSCSKKFNLVSGEHYLGVIRTSLDTKIVPFSIQVSLTDYTLNLEISKLDPNQIVMPEIHGLFMNFTAISDVKILMSDAIPKHKLTLYYHKEVERSLYETIKYNFVTIR